MRASARSFLPHDDLPHGVRKCCVYRQNKVASGDSCTDYRQSGDAFVKEQQIQGLSRPCRVATPSLRCLSCAPRDRTSLAARFAGAKKLRRSFIPELARLGPNVPVLAALARTKAFEHTPHDSQQTVGAAAQSALSASLHRGQLTGVAYHAVVAHRQTCDSCPPAH